MAIWGGGAATVTIQQVLGNGNTITLTDIKTGAAYKAGMEYRFSPASTSNLFSRLIRSNGNTRFAGDAGIILKKVGTGVSITGSTITFDNPIVDLSAIFGSPHTVTGSFSVFIELKGSTSDDGWYTLENISGTSNEVATVKRLDATIPSLPSETCTADAGFSAYLISISESQPLFSYVAAHTNTGGVVGYFVGFGTNSGVWVIAEDASAGFFVNNSNSSPTISLDNRDGDGIVIGNSKGAFSATTGYFIKADLGALTTGWGIFMEFPRSSEKWIEFVNVVGKATLFKLDPNTLFFDSKATSGNIFDLEVNGTPTFKVDYQGEVGVTNHLTMSTDKRLIFRSTDSYLYSPSVRSIRFASTSALSITFQLAPLAGANAAVAYYEGGSVRWQVIRGHDAFAKPNAIIFNELKDKTDATVNRDVFVLHDDGHVNFYGEAIFGGTTLVASAMVQINSTTKGLLPPRMTTAQRNSIASPATGLMVWDTDLKSLFNYDGANWVTVATKDLFSNGTLSIATGDFVTQSITTNASGRFVFRVPRDFNQIISIALCGIVQTGAAGVSKDIDLDSDYGGAGEVYNIHSESDTTSLYTVGAVNTIWELDISGVFTGLSAGDACGLFIKHNLIGGAVNYLGVRLTYM